MLVWGATLFLYWRFLDVNPPILFYQSFGIDAAAQPRKVFKPGETFYAHREFEYTRAVPGEVKMQILQAGTDRVMIEFKSVHESFAIGHYKRDFAVPIPGDVPPGHYVYHVTITYKLNPIGQPVTVVLPPVFFSVEAHY